MNMGNLKARISKLWAAAAARADTGPRLTYPNGAPVVLHESDTAAIAAARAAGRTVFVCDEPLPPGGVTAG
jgi:hypothetical protein